MGRRGRTTARKNTGLGGMGGRGAASQLCPQLAWGHGAGALSTPSSGIKGIDSHLCLLGGWSGLDAEERLQVCLTLM